MTQSWLDDAEGVIAHEEVTLEKRASATTWKPHKDDSHPQVLKGTVLSAEVASTEYGDTPVLTIEDTDGKTWTVWASGRLLRDAIDAQAPAPGKGIAIKHGGLRDPAKPGGRQYRMWTVACEASDFEHWGNQWKALHEKANEAAHESKSGPGAEDEGIF